MNVRMTKRGQFAAFIFHEYPTGKIRDNHIKSISAFQRIQVAYIYLCVCVCVCKYAYMCVWASTHTHTYTNIDTNMYVSKYSFLCYPGQHFTFS